MKHALIIMAAAMIIGRLTIPLDTAFDWPHLFRDLSHIAAGFMIGAAVFCPDIRRLAAWLCGVATAFEVFMVIFQNIRG